MVIYPSDFGLETREELAAFIEERCYGTIGEFLERMANEIESETFKGNRPRAAAAMLAFVDEVARGSVLTARDQKLVDRYFVLGDRSSRSSNLLRK